MGSLEIRGKEPVKLEMELLNRRNRGKQREMSIREAKSNGVKKWVI